MNLIYTLDYEIHGNGDGDPIKLMVEPTYRLMNLLEKYDAKLTILADVAEILCFKQYVESTKNDLFSYGTIVKQLQDAIGRGHDVQLHIHSSYFKAKYNGVGWEQHWPEYNMAALEYSRIDEMIKVCKSFLESILKPVSATYTCHAFRAANWSMMPTSSIYKALVENGITIDTSVYKGGKQKGNVDYNYSDAYSHIHPYKADANDINKFSADGQITEYPIYTEMRYFWSFVTPVRFFRMVRAKFHKHSVQVVKSNVGDEKDTKRLSFRSFFVKSPWKLDFNQASGLQLIQAIKRIRRELKNTNSSTDVVLIGHSKTFIPYNEKTFEKFLKWCSKQKDIESKIWNKR